jgi:hypothetical protein
MPENRLWHDLGIRLRVRGLRSVAVGQLVFLGDVLKGFRQALDAIGQPVVVFDRQHADDYVLAARSRVAECRVAINVSADRELIRHLQAPLVQQNKRLARLGKETPGLWAGRSVIT